MSGGRELGLNVRTRFTQVQGVGSDVSNFEHPFSAEISLDCQVPLLRARHLEMTWNSQYKQEIRWNQAWAATCAAIIRKCSRITSREIQKDRKSTRLNSSHANISYAVFCF